MDWRPSSDYGVRMAAKEQWYRTDEQRFALATAQFARQCFVSLRTDREQLPWTIIALHGATQAAMIAHLTGTAGLGALSKTSAIELLSALNGEGAYPDSLHVAPFLQLVRRLRSAKNQIEVAGAPVELTGAELRSLKLLNALRNDFIHFSPRGWSLEISGLPVLGQACVTIMRGVCHGGWLIHLEPTEVEEYAATIEEIRLLSQTIFD